MTNYLVVIENASKKDILRCLYYACIGVGSYVELTSHSFLIKAETDMVLLRNLFMCNLGPKAKVFITISTGDACWSGNMIDSDSMIKRAIV